MNKKSSVLCAALALALTGCQQHSVKENVAGHVQIKHAELTHLSSLAQLKIELLNEGQVVHQQTYPNFSELPYSIGLQQFDRLSYEQMRVEILMQGEAVLAGDAELNSNDAATIDLKNLKFQSLHNSFWRASDISGRGIPAQADTTLAFDLNGTLMGNSGCNRYRSEYKYAAGFVEIKQAERTRQICSSPIMYHENRYLNLLQQVERFEISDKGQLHLYVESTDQPLVFVPATAQAHAVTMK